MMYDGIEPPFWAEPPDEDPGCGECGNATDDGEGYDGLCGNCADQEETKEEEA